MELEQDKVAQQREDYKKEKEFRKNIIRKAEVYERLKANRDVQEMLTDIRDRAKAHAKAIEAYTALIGKPNEEDKPTEHPLLRRLRIAEYIAFHQTQKMLCEEMAAMPDTVIIAKKESMERLNEIEMLEKEIDHARSE